MRQPSQERLRSTRRRRKKHKSSLLPFLIIAIIISGTVFLIYGKFNNSSELQEISATPPAVFAAENEDFKYRFLLDYLDGKRSNDLTAVQNNLIESLTDTNKQYLANLIEIYRTNPKIEKVIDNISIFPEGLLILVCREAEAVEFVAGYFDNRFTFNDSSEIDVSADIESGYPFFLQWDKRWGYDLYGDDILSVSGCAVTAFSMVAVQITGDKTLNPLKIAEYSTENNYYTLGVGTNWSFVTAAATHFGMTAKEISLDPNVIKNTLNSGKPILVSLGPGDFTQSGHFIVLESVAEDGKINVLDPNSIIRTEKSWDIDVFMNQTKNLWAFSPLE